MAMTMPQNGPDRPALDWVAGLLGCTDVTAVRGLREGGTPWLLRAGQRNVVLRTGRPHERVQFRTEAAALEVAAKAGIAAPPLLGYNGDVLMLLDGLPGTSRIPLEPDERRLRAYGAAAARIHAVPLEPSEALPTRDRPLADLDFAQLRREHGASRLLLDAEEVVAASRPAGEPVAFTHGDLWQGNTLWDGGTLSAVLDWDAAGVGSAGVDLGSVRGDVAVCFGVEAIDLVLAGWEEQAGHPAANVGYWDAVAALATPPDMGLVAATIADQGRPDLNDGPLLNARRDAFLQQALDRLGA